MKRRTFLAGSAAATIALPFFRLLRGAGAHAAGDRARRLIVFYFPDGVPGPSANGDPSQWHAGGPAGSPQLPALLEPIAPYADRCVFFRGLSMGPTDSGSHPGGAKKLLTAVDGGGGISIDRYLADTVGADRPFRHLYLGAMANADGASGDKHISYVSPGSTVAPDDDPVHAFGRLFGDGAVGPGGGTGDPRTLGIIDAARGDLDDLRARLGTLEKTKLDLHLEALRELEQRVGGGGGGGGTCDEPFLGADGIDATSLYQPERFPDILRAQIDVLVQAMACELTRVGVIQGSHHTSELIMSRFPGTEMHDPGFDMRSHQASHYGPAHDLARREFRDFVAQRRWWLEQFAYLLASLDQRPEGDGTMLDYSLVLLCTEVCDGNLHSHDDMPFILAGGGGGTINTGRLLELGYHRHADLLVTLARAMGADLQQFGQASSGPLPGLLA
jgi:hypothetical protein